MIFATSVCTLGSSVQPVTGTTNATKASDSRLWMSTTSCCSKFLVACPSGSNNSWQLYKIILLRATSQPCLQKTSWCQQEKKHKKNPPDHLQGLRFLQYHRQTQNLQHLWLQDSRQQDWAVQELILHKNCCRLEQAKNTVVTVFSSSAVGRVLQGVAYHTQAEQKCFYPVFNKACTITNCTDHSF